MKTNAMDEKAIQRYQHAASKQGLPLNSIYHHLTDRLLTRLSYMRLSPKNIVNFSWHHEHVSQQLHTYYPEAKLSNVSDGQSLYQLGENSADLLIAHFSFFCHPDPMVMLQLCHWVLREGGLLLFVDTGLDTLQELKKVFSKVDTFSHVNDFYDMHDVGDMLKQIGFIDPVMDRESLTLAYKNLRDLFSDLKEIGLRNASIHREKTLYGKTKWQQMLLEYEGLKTEDYYPVSIELIFGHGFKTLGKNAEVEVSISIDKIQKR